MQSKTGVIVTSAGTASAISVIKALKQQKTLQLHIIAVDTDPFAAGLFLADEYEIVPKANDPLYIKHLIDLGKRKNAEILIPIYSKEIQKIAEHSSILRQEGLKTFLSAPEMIEICNDKRKMYQVVGRIGVVIPRNIELSDDKKILFPVFVKPNSGSSSTGTEKVFEMNRLHAIINEGHDIVVQEFIDGEEVTVDIICDERSVPLVVSPRLRLATKSGQSVKGTTISNVSFLEPVEKIATALNIKGVCNMQFFMTSKGLVFNEINPRFAAGGLMLSIAAGANIPLILIKKILGIVVNPSECQAREGVNMTRYWEEIIFEEKNR